MVGGGPAKDKKFVKKILERIRKGKKTLQIVEDKQGSISYTYDIARTIEYLLVRGKFGIYHSVCDGGVSRLDIATFLVDTLGLQNSVRIVPVGSTVWEKEYFSPRPGSERLTNTLLKKLNPSLIRPWRDALADYLNRFEWLKTTHQ